MSYPEDSVGARMDFDLVTVREDVTLEVVLRYLRRFDALPDHTDQVFVVDRHDVLKGALPLDRLLINEPDALVEDLSVGHQQRVEILKALYRQADILILDEPSTHLDAPQRQRLHAQLAQWQIKINPTRNMIRLWLFKL